MPYHDPATIKAKFYEGKRLDREPFKMMVDNIEHLVTNGLPKERFLVSQNSVSVPAWGDNGDINVTVSMGRGSFWPRMSNNGAGFIFVANDYIANTYQSRLRFAASFSGSNFLRWERLENV